MGTTTIPPSSSSGERTAFPAEGMGYKLNKIWGWLACVTNTAGSLLNVGSMIVSTYEGGGEGGLVDEGQGLVTVAAPLQPPVIFKEKWREKEARIRKRSPVGHLPGWRLLPVIVKSNDDLRQEQFAAQLLRQVATILSESQVPVWLRPYDIIGTSYDGGLIEAIPDTVSLDALKKNDPRFTTLTDFFIRLFGPRGSTPFAQARKCFVESLAAYSIICYLLQVLQDNKP